MIKYISIQQVMDDILESDTLVGLKFERAVNYAIRFMEKVGVPLEFEEKTQLIDVKDYRALLPCDFFEMILVRLKDTKHVFRKTTDSFHMSDKHRKVNTLLDLTYKILNSVIFTSIEKGTIEIAYRAIKLDLDGFPLIPDNSSFIDALGLYIEKLYAFNQVKKGKLEPLVYQMIDLEYSWAVGQASADLIRPDEDLMESLTNMWNTLLVRNNEHNKLFVHTGTREYWREHR